LTLTLGFAIIDHINMKTQDTITFALECPVYFLSEQRTELYKKYCSGVAQLKNVLGAKSALASRALPDLLRCGA